MAESIKAKLSSLTKEVTRLRKAGKPWHEIAGETEQAAGKCMLALEFGELGPSDVVTYKNDADLAKKVVRMRDKDKLSWGSIVARTDVGEQHLRTLYESEMGEGSTKGNRIGKGGRFPGGGGGPVKKATSSKRAAKKSTPVKKATAAKRPAAKKTVKKAAAKKASSPRKGAGATAKKAVAKRAAPVRSHPLLGLDFDGLAEKLEGRAISVAPLTEGSKDRTYKVKAVKSFVDGTVEFSDATNGGTHTVRVDMIRKVGK